MDPGSKNHASDPVQHAHTLTDPVCGMAVDPYGARGRSYEYCQTTYFFCSARCRERFTVDPSHYVAESVPAEQVTAVEDADYVCPMYPQIGRDEPGSCPFCGMALEPRTPTIEDAEDPELADMRRRL